MISYDVTNVKNVIKICVPTWSIFAGPVTYFITISLASHHCWSLSNVFHSNCNIMSGMYKRGIGGWWERVSSWRWIIPSFRTQAAVLCLH